MDKHCQYQVWSVSRGCFVTPKSVSWRSVCFAVLCVSIKVSHIVSQAPHALLYILKPFPASPEHPPSCPVSLVLWLLHAPLSYWQYHTLRQLGGGGRPLVPQANRLRDIHEDPVWVNLEDNVRSTGHRRRACYPGSCNGCPGRECYCRSQDGERLCTWAQSTAAACSTAHTFICVRLWR